MTGPVKYINAFLIICSFSAYFFLQNQVERFEHLQLFALFGLLFGIYLFWLKKGLAFKSILIYGVFLRLALLAGEPSLSEDYRRYYLDAHLFTNGINPYSHKPIELSDEQLKKADLEKFPIHGLNSEEYYSVYPPATQLFFSLPALASSFYEPYKIKIFLATSRILIILIEVATLLALRNLLIRLGIQTPQSSVYFLNPLVILEFTGNLHSEFLMVLFLALGLYFLKKPVVVGITIAGATLVKLYPIVLLPFVVAVKTTQKKHCIASISAFSLIVIGSLYFIGSSNILNILSSLMLYYQRFEFNGFIYPVLREVGRFIHGYNTIAFNGKLLSLLFGLSILVIGFVYLKFSKKKTEDVILAIFLVLTMQLFLATTVMPWYTTPILFLSTILRFKTGVVWSALSFLSYSAYQENTVDEHFWLGLATYILILIFLVKDLRNTHLKTMSFKKS